jgi:hypothetical protein
MEEFMMFDFMWMYLIIVTLVGVAMFFIRKKDKEYQKRQIELLEDILYALIRDSADDVVRAIEARRREPEPETQIWDSYENSRVWRS